MFATCEWMRNTIHFVLIPQRTLMFGIMTNHWTVWNENIRELECSLMWAWLDLRRICCKNTPIIFHYHHSSCINKDSCQEHCTKNLTLKAADDCHRWISRRRPISISSTWYVSRYRSAWLSFIDSDNCQVTIKVFNKYLENFLPPKSSSMRE